MTPEQLARAVVATVGHELRTPLASIRGYIETLLEGQLDAATARRFLETTQREALRLGRLVDGMLHFSMLDLTTRQEGGSCNVVEQIEATIEMLAPLATARRVAIRTQLPAAAYARVDGDACVHAITNIVENAVKHGSASGTIEVSCVCGERFVEVAVEDDGNGITGVERDAIFAIGVRGAAHSAPGSGVGLAVVKAIAERAGGEVRVEPSSLGGARFVLRFPAG
jgi:signal transduction histidine kinase